MSNSSPRLAPIGLSTYARLNHLRQTIDSLRSNHLAQESSLFVFSDAAAPGDEAKVQAVREYLATVDGFKRVEVIARVKNGRVENNRGGMRQLLEEFGQIIFLEEDIVTAPGFLGFMNEALNFYRDHPNVLSITGYAPPLEWRSDSDAFALARFCAWGFGITKENFEKISAIPADAVESLGRPKLVRCGRDIANMVRLQAEGRLAALDVMAMYRQCCDGSLTIYPRRSLVQNIGHDGSGVHGATSNRFHHQQLWDKPGDFRFDAEPSELETNLSKMRAFRDTRPWWKQMIRRY
ncbi:MAG: hypothetical protein ACO3SO_05145 [Luteolibacter sp.]